MKQQKILYNESVTKRETMEFDGALIDALRDNGRLPVTELARQLQLPRRRVQERMHALLESGTIRIVANVHPALLGIHLFCDVLIWVEGPSAPVLAELRSFRETTFITAVAGNCDIVVEVGAKDRAHLEQTLAKIRSTGLFGQVITTDSHPRAVELQGDFLRVRSTATLLTEHLKSNG